MRQLKKDLNKNLHAMANNNSSECLFKQENEDHPLSEGFHRKGFFFHLASVN